MKSGYKPEEFEMRGALMPQESDAQKHIFIIGHKNPDCDSVCSAIGYAYFKNIVDKRYLYIPARAGELNSETKFVLEKFDFEPPVEGDVLQNVTFIGT